MAVLVPASALRGGRDYPRSEGEVRAWFPDDRACRDYLEWLRWPNGFVCTGCGAIGTAYRLADLSWWCPTCDTRTSVTAGTIFHRTRTPLTVWFAAAWFLTSQKDGASALGLQRVLGLGSYQTAWAMLHRLRSAMVRPGRDMLSGDVEVDETSIGGVKPGKRGRGAAGKTLVAVAVERTGAKGFGRCRLLVIPDATAPTLGQFLADHVEPGSVVLTDGLKSYPIAVGANYVHKPVNLAGTGLPAHVPLPGVHRIASLVKRWLLSTHQGAVEGDHLQAYLDEFCFRFNRRTARSRGLLFRRLLEQSVDTGPRTYAQLVVNPREATATQLAALVRVPIGKRVAPASLAMPAQGRPWRR